MKVAFENNSRVYLRYQWKHWVTSGSKMCKISSRTSGIILWFNHLWQVSTPTFIKFTCPRTLPSILGSKGSSSVRDKKDLMRGLKKWDKHFHLKRIKKPWIRPSKKLNNTYTTRPTSPRSWRKWASPSLASLRNSQISWSHSLVVVRSNPLKAWHRSWLHLVYLLLIWNLFIVTLRKHLLATELKSVGSLRCQCQM